ncbi:MAG: large-conductance mechanosensitive channel protein MscL [Candidatus Wildermuthbacteria bacterium]|nr:large-conductance mechanosensitive channel protein MscL [Candidatus Wildermuthbacteria bacterium]
MKFYPDLYIAVIKKSTPAAKFFNEFKEFAVKGNVVDLAVGIILGAAFNGVVNSLVKDVIMPPIGWFVGNVDFAELYVSLSGGDHASLTAAQQAGAVVVAYGRFINALIGFVITAFAVFVLVKQINMVRRKREKEPMRTPTTKPCSYCFSEISIKASRCPHCTSQL